MQANLTAFLITLLLMFVMFACGSTETITVRTQPVTFQPSDKNNQGNDSTMADAPFSITIGEAEPVKSLDPLFAVNSSSQRAVSLIYEGLTRLDSDGNVQPAVASDWTISPDSLTYTFSIRQDAFFHDNNTFSSGYGRPVNTADIVYTFTRMASRNIPDNAANLFRKDIKGFDAYFQQSKKTFFSDELLLDGIRGIVDENDSTISISLNKPNSEFLHNLAHPFASVYPSEIVKNSEFGLHNNPVGTGIFTMSHVSGDSLVTLERHFNHYEQQRVARNLTSINIRIYRDESTLFRNMASGIVNYIPQIGPQTAETILTDDNTLLVSYENDYRLNYINSETFYLHYFEDNASGVELWEVNDFMDELKNKPLIGKTSKTLHLQDYSETSEANNSETLMIGFLPDPFISYNARKLVSDIIDNRDVKLYPVRSTNIDLAFLWTDKPKDYFDKAIHVGTFTYPRFSLSSISITGITHNQYSWWIGLDEAQKKQ